MQIIRKPGEIICRKGKINEGKKKAAFFEHIWIVVYLWIRSILYGSNVDTKSHQNRKSKNILTYTKKRAE